MRQVHSFAGSAAVAAKGNKSGKKKSGTQGPGRRVVVENRRARHEYEILDTLECGIALQGSEVKSLRLGRVSLGEAYAKVKNGEVWLLNCDIAEYPHANQLNHERRRPRKLLLHRREIHRFAARAQEKGLTLIPLRIYFNQRGLAKVELALCRGKRLHDKREAMKRREAQREMLRLLHRRR